MSARTPLTAYGNVRVGPTDTSLIRTADFADDMIAVRLGRMS